MDIGKPLFTMFIYAFNHERFIHEAIDSAFSQTYSPIEIILSDDCSTDKTWAIMKEMAHNYKGPHRVILNRNEKNLGVTAHINRIMQLGSGDWFVLGAGDDISLPDRVNIICDAIVQHPNSYGIATALLNINDDGRETGYHKFDMKHPYVTGASGAWHKRCFEFFGDITQDTIAEDVVIPFRSVLLGKLLLIQTPTVKYRSHENSISNPLIKDLKKAWKHVEKINEQLINAYNQRLLDLEKAKNIIPTFIFDVLEARHRRLIDELKEDNINIKIRCKIWELNFGDKLNYLLGAMENLPDRHQSIYYRLKTFIASFKFTQCILKTKKTAKYKKTLMKDERISTITAQDLLSYESNLLIYVY